jgi:beta-N-acetylhexosaminidase
MVGFHGVTAEEAWAALEPVAPGGIILFGRNIVSGSQVAGLVAGLQALAAATGGGQRLSAPALLVAVDQEGGRVARLGADQGFTEFPGNMALGAIAGRGAAKQAARAVAVAMGRELALAGVNLNLAPVLDVNNNPGNPVIGERSFGEDPEAVAGLGRAAVRGYLAGGVLPVGKHFPGHGDTDLDSHLTLPRVPHDRERLRRVELLPFRRAIEAGMPAVMTAHVAFPAVEPGGLPATLSGPVLTGLAREELGFDGVIITDAMEMKAVSDCWGLGRATVMALAAGADLILLGETRLAPEAAAAVVDAVARGRLPEGRLDAAVRRVLTLKARLGRVRRARETTNDGAERRLLAERVAALSITLVRDQTGLLPLSGESDRPWLVVGPDPDLAEAVGEVHRATTGLPYGAWPDARFRAQAVALAQSASLVVVGSRSAGGLNPGRPATPEQAALAALLEGLLATGRPVVWVALGAPYDLTLAPAAPVYLATYSSSRPSLRALAAVLVGRARPRGRLPVTIPGLYPRGHGLDMLL